MDLKLKMVLDAVNLMCDEAPQFILPIWKEWEKCTRKANRKKKNGGKKQENKKNPRLHVVIHLDNMVNFKDERRAIRDIKKIMLQQIIMNRMVIASFPAPMVMVYRLLNKAFLFKITPSMVDRYMYESPSAIPEFDAFRESDVMFDQERDVDVVNL